MLYQIKQAVHLGKRDYKKGIHELSGEVESDPLFLKYVSLGLIVEAEAAKVISPKSEQERAKKLYDKLVTKANPAKAGLAEKPAPAKQEEAKAPVKEEPKAKVEEAPPEKLEKEKKKSKG